MRLIDADILLEKLKKTDRYFMVKYDIEEAPTLPNPCGKLCAFVRPHGEWGEVFEHLGVKYHKCLACYTGIKVDATHHNFCPNCGADMRKEGGSNDSV